ncbi:haloacid dehalogenase-like hydrolase [Actinomadura kijaniata]|uniref:Phosphoglycolate phosphatase-like HAD superfamily hydrolase n=1 Tax=Actinomadura namibiensis TaxID=182080 RepID=A0A7W3QRC8_ACTNM|nr:haloacid dehalogenase-like hydrolase [Actinomadura namibiensis]MBA8956561.1 phosphoglycolate phosphatase-like HAD superfamily hydrolase [Actinomadura namibiensis]
MANRRITTLVLWDVDHTLIETGGVGREIFADAFAHAVGRPMEQMAEVSGRTEPDIFRETAELHGVEVDQELFEKFAEQLAKGYEERAEEMRQRGRALPGAAEALEALAADPRVAQSVLTGNIRPAAETKLRVFGLDRRIDFEAGAYGSDDGVRPRLVTIAQRRAAERYGMVFDAATTVLIGDTPSDVATGREGGARVIAVASGKSTADELRDAGADLVLEDLVDLEALREGLALR